jgi:hypothetical protein
MKFTIGDLFLEVKTNIHITPPVENIFWILVKKDSQGLHLEAGKRKIRYGSYFQLKQLVSSGIYQYFPVVK